MLKQKTVNSEETSEELDAVAVIPASDENNVLAGLAGSLAEIRKLKGVVGYILRDNSSAIVDVADQNKIIDYAILSSHINEATAAITGQFKFTDVESVLVEGADVKVLCITMGENKISVFMEKSAAHAWIIKRILL